MSIEINISNYESYLLSYIDGELNEAEQAALELFLQKHPQFRQELELLEGTRLVPDTKLVFDNKAALYRSSSPAQVDYEELMLGYIDGELTPAEEKTLQAYLEQHPAAQQELKQLQAVKLTPDTSLVFADKASLYRSSKRRVSPIYRRIGWGAAAAAVVAGLIIWLMPAGQQVTQPPAIASATKPVVTAPANTTVSPETAPDLAGTKAPVTTAAADAAPAATPVADAPLLAKNNKAAATRVKKPAATPEPEPALAATTPKADAPVISQLPPQRNSMSEVVEQHLQQSNVTIAAARPEVKEPVLASTNQVTDHSTNKITPVTEAQGVPGELIMSVSGSDSKILDKVTNVAKFFSRKRNK
ncbi:hypothetical protein [Chitinophaga arvensicola]|uniref:Zinc-finger n=1 Tax=Chitinophaga arvensicola TaxID=29529 RepID=A0A1I0NZX9_9BACT|nr:hypothetical protein [Chitinophaga arvensicola]SEW07249.1 hypothetical protein SAMN04488122_0467 [Chitinophaga arvensicola]